MASSSTYTYIYPLPRRTALTSSSLWCVNFSHMMNQIVKVYWYIGYYHYEIIFTCSRETKNIALYWSYKLKHLLNYHSIDFLHKETVKSKPFPDTTLGKEYKREETGQRTVTLYCTKSSIRLWKNVYFPIRWTSIYGDWPNHSLKNIPLEDAKFPQIFW